MSRGRAPARARLPPRSRGVGAAGPPSGSATPGGARVGAWEGVSPPGSAERRDRGTNRSPSPPSHPPPPFLLRPGPAWKRRVSAAGMPRWAAAGIPLRDAAERGGAAAVTSRRRLGASPRRLSKRREERGGRAGGSPLMALRLGPAALSAPSSPLRLPGRGRAPPTPNGGTGGPGSAPLPPARSSAARLGRLPEPSPTARK